jgi:hypothetical protein
MSKFLIAMPAQWWFQLGYEWSSCFQMFAAGVASVGCVCVCIFGIEHVHAGDEGRCIS